MLAISDHGNLFNHQARPLQVRALASYLIRGKQRILHHACQRAQLQMHRVYARASLLRVESYRETLAWLGGKGFRVDLPDDVFLTPIVFG